MKLWGVIIQYDLEVKAETQEEAEALAKVVHRAHSSSREMDIVGSYIVDDNIEEKEKGDIY